MLVNESRSKEGVTKWEYALMPAKSLALLLFSYSIIAKVVFINNESKNGQRGNLGGVRTEGAKQSKEIECSRDNGISYGFLKNILMQETPSYTVNDKKLIIKLPSRVNLCIENIEAEAVVDPASNNLFLKYKTRVKEGSYSNKGYSQEREFELCLKEISKDDEDYFKYENMFKNGHISPPENLIVDLDDVDKERNSKLIIASTNKDLEYGEDAPFGVEDTQGGLVFSDERFNCMNFLKAEENPVMLVRSRLYIEKEEAIAVCQERDLVSINEKIKVLRAKTSGNYNDLLRVLEGVQKTMVDEKVRDMIEKIEKIERDISPSVSDVKNGDKFGVGKKRRKELLKQYAEEMDYFSKDILPVLKSELDYLTKELEELGESNDSERKRSRIEERIEEINDTISLFNRQAENSSEYKRVIAALREDNYQRFGKKVLAAIIAAQEYSSIDSTSDLVNASSKVKRRVSKIEDTVLSDWQDEALIRAGDNTPLLKKKKQIQILKSKANMDKKRFAQKMSAYDKYMQEYAKELVSSYCSSGSNYQDCLSVRNNYLPQMYNQYSNWKSSATSNYAEQFKKNFSNLYQSEQNTLNRYNGLYSQYKLDNYKRSHEDRFSSDFDLWTGLGSTQEYSSQFNFNFLNDNWNTPSAFSLF